MRRLTSPMIKPVNYVVDIFTTIGNERIHWHNCTIKNSLPLICKTWSAHRTFLLSDNLILQSLYLEVVHHTEQEKKGNHFIFSSGKIYTRGAHIASVVKKKKQVSNEYGLALSLTSITEFQDHVFQCAQLIQLRMSIQEKHRLGNRHYHYPSMFRALLENNYVLQFRFHVSYLFCCCDIRHLPRQFIEVYLP